MNQDIYSFEKKGRRKFPDPESESAAVETFADRLGLGDINYAAYQDQLLNFIINHHKVISRYDELLDREKVLRNCFTGISLLLLVIVPILILKMDSWFDGDNKAAITAQVTAVLTGLIAVHKSLSSWLDKRTVIGNFWKAQSELKTKLYAFEDKWKGQAVLISKEDGKEIRRLKEDFLVEIRVAIAAARAIVQEEQSKFFDTITYPSIDIAEMIKGAGASAKDLVNAQVSPRLEELERQRQVAVNLSTKLAEEKAKIVRLETEIAQRKRLIETKRQAMPGLVETDREALKSEIAAHYMKVRQAEDELIVARGLFEALHPQQ